MTRMADRGGTRALAALIAATVLLLGACSGGGDQDESGPVTISFWHGFGGTIAPVLNGLIDEFNAQHAGQIKVVATAQGNYDDAVTKLKAGMQSSDSPNIAQIYEVGTQLMIDTEMTVPVQEFIDKDSYPVDDLQAPFREYFTVGGSLRALPFNGSTPVMYYNRDAFAKAGLNPDAPPASLDQLRAAADALTVRSGDQVTRYGFGAALYSWFLEQYAARSGETYCDQNNGRDGRATRVNLTSPALTSFVDTWSAMVRAGTAVNTGRATTDAESAFMAGRMAITFDSAGLLGSFQQGAGFPVGAARFPGPDGPARSGPVIGGGGLWILDGHPEREQRAAWELAKYLASPGTQAKFASRTGFVPVSAEALSEPVYQQFLAQNPAFSTAIEQVRDSVDTEASRGCLLGVMPQLRQTASQGLENALQGGQPAQQAMAAAAQRAAADIAAYNKSVR